MSDHVSAHPSKAFFVNMLVRDIELKDAIMDLLDNCIDGIQRRNKASPPKDADKPYAGFNATLILESDRFEISDNCGGIPRSVAEEYAFRLGRPSNQPSEELPTVGIYGIGMKRAIFKIGRESHVVSHHVDDGCYSVGISALWMDDDDDWDLPVTELDDNAIPKEIAESPGTQITVTELHGSIKKSFDPQKSNFIDDLRSEIATHYSYILNKGFAVKLNGQPIRPRVLQLLESDDNAAKTQKITPYRYETNDDGVAIDLAVGFYRQLPSEDEVNGELEGRPMTGSKELCGWTIICNDRVVVYNDKTRLTGWGEASVPAYHPQFIHIAGVVRFQSNDTSKLPVTTTKRGIDASSEQYLAVKDFMREGLLKFTRFTNQWKKDHEGRKALLQSTRAVDPLTQRSIKADEWKPVRKGLKGRQLIPQLPEPARENNTNIRISYSVLVDDFDTVADFLFDKENTTPSEVGKECFSRILKRAQS